MAVVDEKVRFFQVESLAVEVHPNATLMGEAAALAAANFISGSDLCYRRFPVGDA